MKQKFSKRSTWLEDYSEEDDIEDSDIEYHKKIKAISSSSAGLPRGWKRATFILKESHINKLKACAYWDRITLKELIEEVIVFYLEAKDVIDIPPKKQRLP